MRNAVWLALALAGSVAPRAVAEEPGGGGGLLTVEGGLVIWTLVVFGLLLYILKRSAWPVLLQAVREREQRLERQLAEAAQAREEAARLLEQQKQALERARADAQEIVTKAKAVAEKERATLLAKAREEYGRLLDAVAGAIQADQRIAVVLESPRVAKAAKARLLEQALRDAAPAPFIRFLQAIVRRGRQGLIGEIAQQYQALLDLELNRVHAGVILATEPDGGLERQIAERLTLVLGKEVRAHFRADAGILGGVIVRVGDRVFDGSLRRKLTVLRRRMLTGD